jgi:hypothetical protein
VGNQDLARNEKIKVLFTEFHRKTNLSALLFSNWGSETNLLALTYSEL